MLSDVEKHDILFFLGWPGKSIKEGSQLFNSVVNDRLNNLPEPVENRVRKVLRGLKEFEERLDCASDRLSASKIDDITMNEEELDKLRKERFKRISELSDLLNIVIQRSSSNRMVNIIV